MFLRFRVEMVVAAEEEHLALVEDDSGAVGLEVAIHLCLCVRHEASIR